jgi:hypothetical protein
VYIYDSTDYSTVYSRVCSIRSQISLHGDGAEDAQTRAQGIFTDSGYVLRSAIAKIRIYRTVTSEVCNRTAQGWAEDSVTFLHVSRSTRLNSLYSISPDRPRLAHKRLATRNTHWPSTGQCVVALLQSMMRARSCDMSEDTIAQAAAVSHTDDESDAAAHTCRPRHREAPPCSTDPHPAMHPSMRQLVVRHCGHTIHHAEPRGHKFVTPTKWAPGVDVCGLACLPGRCACWCVTHSYGFCVTLTAQTLTTVNNSSSHTPTALSVALGSP